MSVRIFFLALASGISLREDTQRPVNRVINLLKEMQKNLEKEATEDQDVYDKLACWCNANSKEKSHAVEIAEQRIAQLTASIEELTGRSAELKADIKSTKEDIASNQRSLDAATALRRKESGRFTAEENDAVQAITALEGAITVLSEHNTLTQESLTAVRRLVDRYAHKHDMLDLMPSQRRMLTGFLQQPGSVQSYSNQSGEIFGILKQMLVNFNENLTESEKAEKAAQETYIQLRTAKEEEIHAGKERASAKTSEHAQTNFKLADAKEDLEDTTNALSADQKFLIDLKKRCKSSDAEFAERTKTRHDEITAVSEAIHILTSDEAHETLGRSLGFLQYQKRRARASHVLRAAAKKNPELSALAVSVRLDAFTKVKKAIDDMIAHLKQEKEDEIAHKDWCGKEFNNNENLTTKADRAKDDLQSEIADLSNQISTLVSDIDVLNAEIGEMHVQTKVAAENRAKENKEFQHTVVDQRATQEILKKALTRLRAFYAKKAEFAQVAADPVPGAAAPAAPEGFKEYKKNQAAGGVVGMIQEIINDSKALLAEATNSEQDAQSGYEEFIANTNAGVTQRSRDIVNKSETKSRAEEDKAAATASLRGTMHELEQLSTYNAELHKSCDFVTKNFDVRQSSRDQEVEALQQAKAILSGADLAETE